MSKSGSKALSKSVDASVKSVVKSVESVVTSVLPKNMNIKHVLLAILVGLLLCMLMGNTVEGFGGNYTNPEEGYCYNYTGNRGQQRQCTQKDAANAALPDNNDYCTVNGQSPAKYVKKVNGACPDGHTQVPANSVAPSTICNSYNNFIDFADPTTNLSCSDFTELCESELAVRPEPIVCSNLNDTNCPGSENIADNVPDNAYRLGQKENCTWQKCNNFATSKDDVETAFETPGIGDVGSSVERWAKCIEEGPGKWAAMKDASGNASSTSAGAPYNTDAWIQDSSNNPVGWGVGSPTGKSYDGRTSEGDAITAITQDKAILKPLIFKGANGRPTTAFGTNLDDVNMFPSELWKKQLREKIKFCGAPPNTDLDTYTAEEALDAGAIIGWDHDKSKFICLNKNPAVSTEIHQTRYDVVKGKGCGTKGGDNCTEAQYCAGECTCTVGSSGPSDSDLDVWATNCADSNVVDTATERIKRSVREAGAMARGPISDILRIGYQATKPP